MRNFTTTGGGWFFYRLGTVRSGIDYDILTWPNVASNLNFARVVNYALTINFDSRIFSDPGISASYVDTSGYYELKNRQVWAQVRDVVYTFNFSFSGKTFSGVSSLVALSENGVTVPGFDYPAAVEFLTFKKSYENYGGQVKSAFDLDKARGASEISQVKNDIAQKIDQEKQSLQNTRLQITVANQNAIQSAQRDYSQMLLTAQTLKNSLLLLAR
jgi:hypothetical protein